MIQRIVRYLLAAMLVTAGLVGVTAAPALAVGGCNTTNSVVRPCIDYGGGTNARADFYLRIRSDNTYYKYRVSINTNGTWRNVDPDASRFGPVGRHCCWYASVDGLPDRAQSAFTRVYVFNINDILVLTADSPTIRFVA
jgi:hypothetical protein